MRFLNLCGHMTLIASGTGYIEFLLTVQAEGNSPCEQYSFVILEINYTQFKIYAFSNCSVLIMFMHPVGYYHFLYVSQHYI